MRHEMAILVAATEAQQRRAFENSTVERLLALDADFEMWAHDNQLPPKGEGWRTWLMMAGRGFGKTRAGAEWIFRIAEGKPGARVALVGGTIADARAVMVEGVSGLLAVARRHGRNLKWEPSLGRLRWPNGSQAQLFSGDNPNGLRGPEHDFAWCDELAKWRQPHEAWMNLQMGLRRGVRPRALVTTTPKPLALLKLIKDEPWTVSTSGRTDENVNLDERFVDQVAAVIDDRTAAGDQCQRAKKGRVAIDPDHMPIVSETPRPAIALERSTPISARALGAGAPLRNGALRLAALNTR